MENQQQPNGKDPALNVSNLIEEAVNSERALSCAEIKRIDDKIDANDVKYQIQFNDSKEAVSAALAGQKEAVNKADQANEKRFDAVNEFRATLSDQQSKLLTSTEYDSAHKSLIEKIDGVENRINRTEGQSNVYVTQTDLNNAIDKLATTMAEALKPIRDYMNNQQGRSGGANALWGYVVGAIGLIATLLAILAYISN